MKTKIRNFDIFFNLTKRHFLVFFKDKMRVFYTLMVPLIVLAVYVLFLRALEYSGIESALKDFGITLVKNDPLYDSVMALVDSWMLSGIIAVSTITIAIQTNNTIVHDKEDGVNRDFVSSPINNNLVVASYFLFNYIVTVLLSVIVILITFLYLLVNGEFMLNFIDILTIFGILLYSSLLATLFTLFICSFIKKESTLSSIIAVLSAAAGFLTGAYMPFSMMPEWVQNVCCFVPGTSFTALFRYAFLSTPINNVSNVLISQYGVTAEQISGIVNSFGYNISFFGTSVGPGWNAIITLIFIGIFVVLAFVTGSKLTSVISGSVIKISKKTRMKNHELHEEKIEKRKSRKEDKDN